VIIASPADTETLLPPLRTTITGRMVTELLFDPLMELGATANPFGDSGFEPRLATRWTWDAEALALTLTLDPAARWHDGRPVVAADVVTGYRQIMDPANGSPIRSEITDLDSVTARDTRTAILYFRRPTAEPFVTAAAVVPLPSHLIDTLPPGGLTTSAFAQHPIGSGRYRFVTREPKTRTEFAAVPDHYRGRPGPDRLALVVTPDPATGIAKLWAGEVDVWDNLPPAEVAAAAAYPQVRLIQAAGWDYAFIAFNYRDPSDTTRAHPLLAGIAMRRALSHAVDREQLVRALFDTLATPLRGPFVRAQFTADTTLTPPTFDTTAANRLLDSLGWSPRDRMGIRRQAGRPLRLQALVPAPSANRVRASVIVQEQLRRVGVDLVIDRREGQAFGAARDAGRFDLVFHGVATTPSVRGLRSTWASRTPAGHGRLNAGNFRDAAFDRALDAGLAALDPVRTQREIRTAYRRVVDDAAAIWLYEPIQVAGVHRRFRTPAWRSDAWWRTIGEWRLDPAASRLPRDARPLTP
jgi:peptide/nickel transport system substrate-binding protein